MAQAWPDPFVRFSSTWLKKAILSQEKLFNVVWGGGKVNHRELKNHNIIYSEIFLEH